ncbi:MAG: hypothetical protein KC776_18855 [Myxococcales bacterium]|nr:hypothetical protein [Myxococcales bacterium]MCB9576695.1 hypothetical protein [Polyangiaceae bacterium]
MMLRRSGTALILLLASARCATSEDDPVRKVPGGYVDATAEGSGATGGSAGTGGGAGSGGAAGSEDAGADASEDAPVDAPIDAPVDALADVVVDVTPDASPPGTLLLISRNTTSVTLGAWDGSSWSTSPLSLATSSAPALVSGSFGALGVLRANAQDELTYVSWSAGTWSSAAPVGTAGWTLGTPALASATSAYLAFIGTDFKFYSTTYATSSWTTFAPVTVGANPSFGPAAPALAARASERCLVFEGSDGDLYSQSWTSGGFQAAYGHGLSTHVLGGVTPAIVARDGSNSWVVVYAQMGGALMWTQGNQTAWSAPAAVASGASSTSPVALLALPGGDVLLAYRGSDDKLHSSRLSGSSWSAPESPYPTTTTTASPSLALGIGSFSAHVALISGGGVLVGSLSGSAWGPTTPVVSNQQQAVAIARVAP